MLTISVMTEKDTKFAAQLTDEEKWGHTEMDLNTSHLL